MVMNLDLKENVRLYISNALPSLTSVYEYFDFIDDKHLRFRLAEEYLGARYCYKFFEGIRAEDWEQQTQVRLQVLLFASVYEAIIHHVLFKNEAKHQVVIDMVRDFEVKEQSLLKDDKKAIEHMSMKYNKKLRATYTKQISKDITKIRFDSKANAAAKIGIIDESMRKSLIKIYEVRNCIHIHAEVRKKQNYPIDLGKMAYQLCRPLCQQIKSYFEKNKPK
jgi:rubrerythrin